MVLTMERWIGKVAVVTGASAGLGAAIAEKLVFEGMVVVGLARRVDKMEEAARKLIGKRGSFHPIKCDLSVENEILNAFSYIRDHLGTVHVLVNNAGMATLDRLIDGESDAWRKTFEVNVIGLCVATREAIKDMRANSVDGHIIHINSIFGHKVDGKFNLNVYSPTKYAITSLAETLRHELKTVGSKIKITDLSPGISRTEIFEATGIAYEIVRDMVGSLPLMEPQDLADGVVYVLSTPPDVQVAELIIKPMHEVF